ncbi:MAG: hypothetical protein IPP33_18890 [Flavobacteriales bacterium]|nr:hypothetical protein [Flavobacteriales bacterium]
MYSGTQLFFIYSGLFFGALMFALVTNSVFMRFFRTFRNSRRAGGGGSWAGSQKPAFGGIGFFIIFFSALLPYTEHCSRNRATRSNRNCWVF